MKFNLWMTNKMGNKLTIMKTEKYNLTINFWMANKMGNKLHTMKMEK